ncbi:MAG: protein kinase [Clostridia bacterium]|nr:protein kinase [Clostridia bacterium]
MDINYYKSFEPIDGKWYITKAIGSGSFGTVFEIERRDFSNLKAALKVISIPVSQSEVQSFREENYDLDEKSVTAYFYSFVEEFIKEFQLMAKLKGHSNIVSYEDHDVIKKSEGVGWDIFIRMELLTPMNKYFAQNAPTRRDVIKLGIDICKALEVCQKFKIIHRDIKPSNIFVSETGEYKLGDFGVARTLEKTSSGLSKKGTYTYMAPEVYKGEAYGSNVDIYSLGIVMYKLLNNNLEPFRRDRTYSDGERALETRMQGAPVPKPANADGRLAEIVLKACCYNPKERYESPHQLREELEQIYYTESEGKVIYPGGDKVFYEPSNDSADSNNEDNEKTETVLDSINNETAAFTPSEIYGINETVSEKPDADFAMEKQNEENKKGDSRNKKIIAAVAAAAACLLIGFGLFSHFNKAKPSDIPVAGIEGLPEESLNMVLGDTYKLEAHLYPENATVLSNQDEKPVIEYKSSDETVASVDKDGTVTAVSEGTAVIEVSSLGFTKEIKINVTTQKVDVTEIIGLNPAAEIAVGESTTVYCSVLPENATVQTVTYSSSDESVATIGPDGAIWGIAPGTATISATADNVTAEMTLTVKAREVQTAKTAAPTQKPVQTKTPSYESGQTQQKTASPVYTPSPTQKPVATPQPTQAPAQVPTPTCPVCHSKYHTVHPTGQEVPNIEKEFD